MEDKGSLKVLDLYQKANDNKSKIVLKTEDGKEYSKAEMVVLSCMAVLVRSLEDVEQDIDYERVIKTIILKSINSDFDGFKKKDEYNKLVKDYDYAVSEEGFCASTTYDRMINSFNNYLNPRYLEEEFVNKNLVLHDKIRQGHIYWGVNQNRVENILEHIYGCLVLLAGIESEYGYSIDFNKIRKMLLLHETGEIIIGDITEWDMPKEEKLDAERKAVIKLLSSLPDSEQLIDLFDEFNDHRTLTSEYAYLIDKIEYDMQVKMYEKSNSYDFNNYPKNVVTESDSVQSIINDGAASVFDVHYEYDKSKYNRIPCFRRILEETKNI